jgi:hypothetical protein
MRRRLTYANVMSTIAVFLALGLGGAWAADKLKKNSVSSKQVKNESIVSKDLKNGKAVTGGDVSDGSLGSADLGAGAVGSEEIADGSVGAGDTSREAIHVLDSPGEPALSNGGEGDCIVFSSFTQDSDYNPVGFYRDSAGVVHLTGTVQVMNGPGGDGACTSSSGDRPETAEDAVLFVLPPGFRPEGRVFMSSTFDSSGTPVTEQFEVVGEGPSTTAIGGVPLAPGTVWFPSTSPRGPFIPLDGISFRAAR